MAFLVLNLGETISNTKAQSAYVELLYDICSIVSSSEAYDIFSQNCAIVT
jgi:hypothetical protein